MSQDEHKKDENAQAVGAPAERFVMQKSQFTRREAMTRSAFEYGIHPYEPNRPCKILGGSVTYECHCGFKTNSSSEIYDHCINHSSEKQMDIFSINEAA